MPAPTNISFLTATDLGTITAEQAVAVPVTQQVDDSGTIYTVYYSFTTPPSETVMGAFAFGDLVHYRATMQPYVGPASSPTPVNTGAVIAHNVPCQFTVAGSTQYFLEIAKSFGDTTPANLTLTIYVAPNSTVPAGSFAVPDDNNVDLPMALVSASADYTTLKFVNPFPSGEAGDTLENGVICVVDISDNSLKVYNQNYALMASIAFGAVAVIRTCVGAQNFYVGKRNTNPTVVYVVSSDGSISTGETLTAMTSCNALAASNDETILYHVFTGNNQSIRRWDLVGHAAGANLAAGIANYTTGDILVLSDDSILASYYKSTVTRDFKVLHYSAAGATLHTLTGFAVPSGSTIPRLAYALPADNPAYFWVMLATAGAITKFYKVKISDGSFAVERTYVQFENGVYGASPTATPLEYFGPAFSCPFWLTRTQQTTTETFEIRRQRRLLLPSSDDNKRMTIPTLDLLMRTGIGLSKSADTDPPIQGQNPQVMLRISKDGGKTWGPERWRSAGEIGNFVQRVRWLQATGQYRNAVCEITVTDPCDFQFLAMMAPDGIIEGSS